MTEAFKGKPSRRVFVLLALILGALLSVFVLSKLTTSPAFTAAAIQSLDEKQETVTRLAVAAAASSTALSLIPGDVATPIANQIAELTSYFIVILAAILLEKVLMTVVGHLTFVYLIPAACLLGALYLFFRREFLLILAVKLALFGVVLFAAIPASIHVSDMIYDLYRTSMVQTLETVEQNQQVIDEKNSALSAAESDWMGRIGSYITDFTAAIGADLKAVVSKGEDTLAAFMDAVAVLIITACVIPVVVLLVFVWVIRILFSFDVRGLTAVVKGSGHSLGADDDERSVRQ